jgi:MOSC domain-containing protein YiiM
VEVHDDHFPITTVDADLFPAVATRGWVFLTQDGRIRYRPVEIAALREAGLAVFVVSSGNLSAHDTVAVLERARHRIERLLESQPRPFVARVAKDGSLRVLE